MNAAIVNKKDDFLSRMSLKFSTKNRQDADDPLIVGVYRSPLEIAQILRSRNCVYNPQKEVELEEIIADSIRTSIMMKHTLVPIENQVARCWLHEITGCGGFIEQRGKFKKCSVGGVSHYFASKRNDPIAFLEQYNKVAQEKRQVEEEQLKEWRKGTRIELPRK